MSEKLKNSVERSADKDPFKTAPMAHRETR